jgi:hypothetical protein
VLHTGITLQILLFARSRAEMVRNWLQSEFEIVNTTFLSDLDY